MSPTYPQTMDIHAGRYSGTSSTANVDGSASQPSIAFGDDQDTGIYSPSDNKIAFTVAGGQSVCVDSDGIDLPSGKVIKVNGSTILTATSFTGTAANATNAASATNATNATNTTNVTVADESSDTTCFPLFTTAATGNLPPKSGSNLTFNSSSGLLTATSFAGASTTQSAGDNSTKLATTAYVDTATAALVDSAPTNLNTLNELAAALNDDADLANTVNTSIATKLPLAGGQMTGNITFSGSQTVDGRDVSVDGTKLDGIAASATAVGGSNGVDFNDAVKVRFGTGNDIQIFHDNSNSLNLLRAYNVPFKLQTNNDEDAIVVNQNGSVELYHDDNKKFETKSTGVGITGELDIDGNLDVNSDTAKLKLGAGDDLQLYHDGSNSYIYNNGGDLRIWSKTDEYAITCIPDGAVELYHNNVKKLETHADGVVLSDYLFLNVDGKEIRIGAGDDLRFYHDGTDSIIRNITGQLRIRGDLVRLMNSAGSEVYLEGNNDGNIELYYDNSKKLETTSYGASITGRLNVSNLQFPDYDSSSDLGQIRMGASNDLMLWHDGSNSWIENTNDSTDLYIKGIDVRLISHENEDMIKAVGNGAVELHYDGSKKFETYSDGIKVIGSEGSSSAVQIIADDGDDNGDTWEIRSNQDVNDLTFKNNTGGSLADILTLEKNGRVWLTGGVFLRSDSENFSLGAGDDLTIGHNGSDSTITNGTGNLRIRNAGEFQVTKSSTENMLIADPDGSVDLYYDNSLKFHTRSDGIRVIGDATWSDDGEARFGPDGDLRIYHDGSNNYIVGATGQNTYIGATNGEIQIQPVFGTDHGIRVINNAAVELYYDGSKKFETTSDGAWFSGHIRAGDNSYLKLGASSDLQIYHDGTDTFFKVHTTGDVIHRAREDWLCQVNCTDLGADTAIKANQNSSVELYYDNTLKLNTSSSGATCHGTLAETSDVALKRHIKVIDNSLTKLKEIKGYTYQFKENGQSSVGVIAQEVEKVFPQLVHGVEGTKSVDYSGLIGVLIESVKELNTEVDTNASDIVNNGALISECTSNVSGVIDDDKIESKTQIQDGINKIKALTSYQVTLKEDSKIRDGFLSSDVKTIYGREETSLIPTLTAALSEAIKKIEALEAKVSALEAK